MEATGTTAFDGVGARFRAAHEARDIAAMVSLLADDVVLHSPISARVTFRGRGEVAELFGAVLPLLGELRYRDLVDAGPLQVLVWSGDLAGREIEETILLRLSEGGEIEEITLFIRPLPGLINLLAILGPRLARMRGRPGRALVAKGAAPLAAAVGATDRLSGWVLRRNERKNR